LLIWSQLIHIHKYEKFCSKLGRYFERYIGFREKDDSICADDGRERDGTYIAVNILLVVQYHC
jgi:hypothetical protein